MTGVAALARLDRLHGVRTDEPMAGHTTYRIGGPAERYVEVATAEGLAEVLAAATGREVPVFALGNGSNILVADAGIDGLVVRLTDRAVAVDGNRLRAGAGARMVKVAQAAQAAGLGGMEWALGIPGCAGGSVHNNAGCFGSDIAAVVASVEAVGPDGAVESWSDADCRFRYRASSFRDGPLQGWLVTEVAFDLDQGDPADIAARMEHVQQERHRTQPVSGRSTGSVFKNPPGDYAGRLIEAAGLKASSVGGAMVSREHANFIVNAGGATAADVAALVRSVRAEVRKQFEVALELEIEAVGRWGGEAFGE
jgi:UDP-N-acetylmuramate dehydrogenase